MITSAAHHGLRVRRLRVLPDPVLKMVGVGLAVAVAIDATIVRVVLVPALMSLLGDRAWWLPRWLDRTLPSVNLDATTPAPTTRRPCPPRTRQQPDGNRNLCPCPTRLHRQAP